MTSPISPLRSMLKLGRVILLMSCMLSCIAQFLHHIWIAICLLAYYINHIFELYHAIMFTQYIHIIYLNYGMATHLIKTSYSNIISSCLHSHHILNYVILSVNYIMPSCFHRRHVCDLWHANHFNRHIVQLYHVILFTQSSYFEVCHSIMFSQPSYM